MILVIPPFRNPQIFLRPCLERKYLGTLFDGPSGAEGEAAGAKGLGGLWQVDDVMIYMDLYENRLNP